MGPVVAPSETTTTRLVAEAETICAVFPSETNDVAGDCGTEVRARDGYLVPTGPDNDAKENTAVWPLLNREIDWILPTAS